MDEFSYINTLKKINCHFLFLAGDLFCYFVSLISILIYQLKEQLKLTDMADLETSHSSLYKLAAPTLPESVSRRRDRLLAQQKLRRQTSSDDQRGLQELLNQLTQPKSSVTRRHKRSPTKYKNTLQLSEWLAEKPDDLENWFMVGCPKGNRCIVVANAGKTLVYGKNGGFIRKLHSQLPGDAGNHQDVTILDCVYVKDTDVFWVMDALAYGKLDLINCDVSCRFFWIRSRFNGDEFGEVQNKNDAVFKFVQSVDCGDMSSMSEMLGTFPMYELNVPELDGLLFYHKESSYVHGKTPLVGWLFPFMVPEVLGIDSVHPNWLALRPDSYVDAKTYISEFDAALKRKSSRRKGREMEVDDELDANEMEADLYLERTGKCVDDNYYELEQ